MTNKILKPLFNFVEQPKSGFWGDLEQTNDRKIRVRVVTNGDAQRLENIQPETLPIRYFSLSEYKRSKLIRGDIVITTSGEPGSVSRLMVDRDDVVASNFIKRLRAKPDVNPTWLFYTLNSSNVRKQLNSFVQHSVIANLSADYFQRVLIPDVKKLEQQSIAMVLSKIDGLIEKTEALISKHKKIKTGIMQDIFLYGIDGKGNIRNKNVHKFKNSILGNIPIEWEVKKLGDVSDISDGTHQGVSLVDDGVPFLYVSCIRDGKVKWDLASNISPKLYSVISKGKEPRAGMILYTVVGSYGHAALINDDKPFAFQRHIACLFPKDVILSEYLVYWLSGDIAKAYAEVVALGNAQKTITLKDLATFPIILPKMEEQEKIVETISKVTNLINGEEKYLKKLVKQKAGIMEDLLTGKVSTSILLKK